MSIMTRLTWGAVSFSTSSHLPPIGPSVPGGGETEALRATHPDGYVNSATILADLDWFVARGAVPQRPAPAALVDNSFVDYALTILGPYSPR